MKLFIVRSYTKRYPHLKGKELTDQLILDLAVVYGLPKDRIGIDRTEKGKPYLKIIPDAAGAQEALPFISVSHCADTFACAFDDELIGIDIQDERVANIQRIAKRYFNEEEQHCDFYTIWTRKEALCKFTGEGLGQVLSGESVLHRTDVRFENFDIDGNLHACICRPVGKEEGEQYEIQYFNRE